MHCYNLEGEGRKNFISERLLAQRTITIFGEVTQELSKDVTEKMMVLAAESADPIKVIVNSPGGHVESADTIYDMISFINVPVKVIGTGWVASAGALIFAAPALENRFALPNTRFLLHQPAGGAHGQASDISIEANEILKMRSRLNDIFARQTGQTVERIKQDTDRNFWMSAIEAKEYGLVGHVVRSIHEI
jgi:ATP-dependent Clp protease protease subunit